MSSVTAETDLKEKLSQVISNIRTLPTPPIVFEQIQKKINDPDVSVNDIASILAEDPAMSVKVLKLTNSAFYGLSREVDSVQHAVMIIGLEAVKNLVLSASVLGMFKSNSSNKAFHDEFWRHSLSSAVVAKILSREYKGGRVLNPDTAFTGGLIHDIGKMIMCCFIPDKFSEIQQYNRTNPEMSDLQVETIVLGFSHAQLGRQLGKTWKLPGKMADTIGYHHSPDLENDSGEYAHLICLANYLAHLGTVSEEDQMDKYTLPDSTREMFGVTPEFIDDIKAKLIQEYLKAETFMAIAGNR